VARMNQFPNQGFRDSFGKLFCGACSTRLHNCKSMIAAHLETKKHKANLIKLQSRSAGDIEIMSGLNQYFIDNPNMGGANLSNATLLYRYRLTQSFMYSGIEPSKIDHLRPLLTRAGEAATHSSHLMPFVPKVEADEFARILDELENQVVSALFDGETRVGEAVAMILRFCTADFKLQQLLVSFVTVAKHMDGQEMSTLFLQLLLTRLQVP
jgi:hypothetical protein